VADTTKATTTTTTAHLLSRPTAVLDTISLHTHHMEGRRQCTATPHISHNTPIMAAIPSSHTALSINRNLVTILTGHLSLLEMAHRAVVCEAVQRAVAGAAISPTCLGLPVKAPKVVTLYSLGISLECETKRRNQRHSHVSSLLLAQAKTTTIPSGRLPTSGLRMRSWQGSVKHQAQSLPERQTMPTHPRTMLQGKTR
jgi:hypothetical protein